MIETRVGRNDPCPCGSGKKFKKCCLRPANGMVAQPHINGHSLQEPAEPTSPTYWSHPPGQPDSAPPAGGEWVEYVFVKDKGWTHESDLKPGDQYRLKGGDWGTVEPERVIRTTNEHPFYVHGKGWTPLAEIRPGDIIRTDNGWVPVTKIEDTGHYETVYNLRVQDYHTYFVGAQDWGFGVWAHNTYQPGKQDVEISKLIPPSSRPVADPIKLAKHGPFDWKKYTPIEVETDGTSLWLMNGMTRVENARRAGITHLPANVYRR